MKTHAVLKFDSVLALDLRVIFYTIEHYLFMHAYFFVENDALSKFCWDYKGLKGILVFMADGTKPKFYSVDENKQLMFPDLTDISAPAHSFSIRMTSMCAYRYTQSLKKEQHLSCLSIT